MRTELAAYGAGLDEKPEIVALSKVDTVDAETLKKQTDRLKRAIASAGLQAAPRPRVLKLSSATRLGVDDCLRAVRDALADETEAAAPPEQAAEWRP